MGTGLDLIEEDGARTASSVSLFPLPFYSSRNSTIVLAHTMSRTFTRVKARKSPRNEQDEGFFKVQCAA